MPIIPIAAIIYPHSICQTFKENLQTKNRKRLYFKIKRLKSQTHYQRSNKEAKESKET
jgi:hypothetical protein